MNYKLLTKFSVGDKELTEGEVVSGEVLGTQEEVDTLLADGIVEAVEEDSAPVEIYDGPMGQYKITGVAKYTDEKGDEVGELEVGSVQTLPKPVGDQFVADGVAEEVAEAGSEDKEEEEGDEVVAPKKINDVEIVSDGFREVNGKNYHHVKLADGTSFDLTDEEYELKVLAPQE